MAGKADSSGPYGIASLDKVTADINRDLGAGSLMTMGNGLAEELPRITTGSVKLDRAIGGGYPRGRIIEIYGPESSGKTSLALTAAARVQQAGGVAAFIDAEHALSREWCESIGLDPDLLLISQPDSGEQALRVANMLIRSGAVDLVVVDSVAALVPKAEIDGQVGDSHVGLQARLMSQSLRMMANGFTDKGDRKAKAVLIFINQLREKIGVQFGNPETTTGGKALKFYASVRLDVRPVEVLTGKGGRAESSGRKLKISAVKNKTAPPYRVAEVDIYFGAGVQRAGVSLAAEVVDLGVETGLIRKAGAFYTFPGQDSAVQGRDASIAWLDAAPDVLYSLGQQVMERLQSGTLVVPEPEPEEKLLANVGSDPFQV
jgi:recombination protein RecA